MALGEALGGVIGGVLGNNAAKMDRAHQKKLMNQAIAEYQKIGYPPDYAKALVLQEFESAGMLTPQLEEDLNDAVAESEVGKIEEDADLRGAQTQALQMMQQRAKVGLSAEDRAALNQVRQQVQSDSQAKQGQILQEMQARGQGGSGAELIARLQAGQAGADRASSQSDTLMAQAQERALQALGQSGTMAGQVRGQDFNVANTKATALDERNRFLNENSINRQTRNTGALNAAQQQNLANKQNIMNANTSQFNAEKQRQAQAQQQTYQDKLNYAAGITGQQRAMADYHGATGDAKAAAQVAMGKGIGGMADSGYNTVMGSPGTTTTGVNSQGQQYSQTTGASKGMMDSGGGMGGMMAMFSDENLKNEIEYTDDDVQKWLDGLSTKILRKK